MVNRSKQLALTIVVLLLSSTFAGLAAGGSRYPLTVVLWNEDADFHPAGSNFTAWAQVYLGDTPINATGVTFRFGLDFPPVAPWVNYAGLYAGSPGLYRATINITAFDTFIGISQLGIIVTRSGDTAMNFRIVVTNSTTLLLGGPAAPTWSVQAGFDNPAQLGPTADPGETVVWRIETKAFGASADAPSLTANLFIAPDVDFTETPQALTPQPVGTGAYEVSYTIPGNWVESRQLVLQVTINEANFAQNNASVDVWFYDTAAHLDRLDATSIAGGLVVGDGRAVVPGLAVNLTLSDLADASHVIGNIAGTTSPTGQLAFDITNDGTYDIAVRGWVNGTRSQFVSQDLIIARPFVPPQPDTSRFDALPLEDSSRVPWAGTQTIPFEFWANGTLWANKPVHAFVSSSRGQFLAANLTTDASGQADVTVDFDLVPFVLEDAINQGMNFTFRAPTGFNNASSDGLWWGEDEEFARPDATLQTLQQLIDSAITFSTTTFTLGSPLGVGAKYTGSKNVSTYRGITTVVPGSFIDFIMDNTQMDAIWTGHDAPFISYVMDGDGQEFFGTVWAPSYWPNMTYSVVTALAPHPGNVGGEGGAPIHPLGWVEITPGSAVAGFSPTADTTSPEVYGPADMVVDAGTTVTLSTQAYDNTIDFFSTGNYTWFIDCGVSNTTRNGSGVSFRATTPGACNVDLTIRDSTGHSTVHSFVITVLDVLAPTVDAGLDFTAVAGELVWLNGTVGDDDPNFPSGGLVEWSFDYNGSTVVRTGPSTSFTFWALGTYTATLRATDAANNTAADTVVFTIGSPDTTPPLAGAGIGVCPDDCGWVAGVPLYFYGTATDDDLAWPAGAQFNWSFIYNGSVQNISGANFTFTFWVPGTYVLTFTARDAWGNVGQDTLTIVVGRPDNQPPVVNAGADQTVDVGTDVSLLGSATDNDPAFPGGARYYWLFTVPPNSYNLSGASTNFVFDQPGAFTVTFWVSDAWGNIGTDTVTITVRPPDNAPPTVQPLADATVVVGATYTFTAAATDNAANFSTAGNYSWFFAVGYTAVTLYGNNAVYTFDTAGDYIVSLRVRDGSGNAAPPRTFTVHVVVPDTTPPEVQGSPSSPTVEAGTDVTLSGAATDGGNALTDDAAFTWTFTYNGSTVTLTGRTAHFTFELPGTYDVTLRVLDASGNSATSTFTVTVTEKPAPPPATTSGSGFELYAILAVLALVAVLAAVMVRRRKAPPQASPPPPESAKSESLDDRDKM